MSKLGRAFKGVVGSLFGAPKTTARHYGGLSGRRAPTGHMSPGLTNG